MRVVDSSTIAAIAFNIEVQRSSETILIVDASERYISASVLVVGDGVFEVLAISGKQFLHKREEQQLVLNYLSGFLKAILARARVNETDLNKIFLTGSTSQLQAVETCIQQVMHRQVTKTAFSEIAVVLGASIQAGVLSGLVSDILLLDAAHSDFSVRTADGKASPLISAGFAIPTKKSEKFTTITNYQTSIEVPVLQVVRGIAEADAEIIHLGSFRLDGIAPAPAGVPSIEITFDIDANGLLSITAKDQTNGQEVFMVDRNLYQGLEVRSTIRERGADETTASAQQADYDLEIPVKLTSTEMSRGVQKEIKLEGEEKIVVKIPAGVKPGQRIRIRGKGKFNSSKQEYGDLYLKVLG